MLTSTKSLLLAALGSALLLTGCQDKNAPSAVKDGIATYSYSDGLYSETVTLRANGQYVQSEKASSRPLNPVSGTQGGIYNFPGQTFKTTGTWRLLDKQGGKPLPLPASAEALPHGAVVELLKAMPFGLTYESRSPMTLQENRVLLAGEFKVLSQAATIPAPVKTK